MKGLILAFTMMAGLQVYAADPACSFVDQTMTRAREILEIKDDSDRTVQLCSLLKAKIGAEHIADIWLGTYINLTRDQAGIDQFKGIVPSIMMTKALPALGAGGKNGSFEVDAASVDRGNGVSEVGVTIHANGKTYKGTAIVELTAGGYNLIDVEYMGFSAVDYAGREYQKFLTKEFNKDPNNSLPVTALVQNITVQDDYVACP